VKQCLPRGADRAEEAVGLVVDPGAEEQRPSVACHAVSEPEAPEAVDLDGVAVRPVQPAEPVPGAMHVELEIGALLDDVDGDAVAARVTSENLGRGTERMGVSERKGAAYLAEAATAEANAVLNAMRERGVLVGTTGRDGNVLKIRPPLVLAREEAQVLIDVLEQVFEQRTASR